MSIDFISSNSPILCVMIVKLWCHAVMWHHDGTELPRLQQSDCQQYRVNSNMVKGHWSLLKRCIIKIILTHFCRWPMASYDILRVLILLCSFSCCAFHGWHHSRNMILQSRHRIMLTHQLGILVSLSIRALDQYTVLYSILRTNILISIQPITEPIHLQAEILYCCM